MIVMENFNDFLKEQLKDPELKSEYDLLEAEFDKLQKRIDNSKCKRKKKKLKNKSQLDEFFGVTIN